MRAPQFVVAANLAAGVQVSALESLDSVLQLPQRAQHAPKNSAHHEQHQNAHCGVHRLGKLMGSLKLQTSALDQSRHRIPAQGMDALGRCHQLDRQRSPFALAGNPIAVRRASGLQRLEKRSEALCGDLQFLPCATHFHRRLRTDPGQRWLSTSAAPISWPIASLERGSLGTDQVMLLGRVFANVRVRGAMVDRQDWFLDLAGRVSFKRFQERREG